MRKLLLLILAVVNISIATEAQEGYRISGKINGMEDSTLLLMSDENGKPKILDTTQIKNGTFMFMGKINNPMSVYITTVDGSGMIPLILENANFMVNVSGAGALIQGGKQQELLTRFTRVSQSFMAEQAKVAAEAQQPGANVQALQDRVNKAYEASVNATMELIKANPDEYATAHVIALGISGETEEGLRSKYDLLGEAARATVPGKRIAAALEQYEKLAIGEMAPNFTTEKPDGNTFSLHDLPAKLKLVYFWVSTNPLCRQDNTDLVKLYLQYRPLGLEIVSISLDENRGDWRNAVGQDGMVWINGSDLQGFASPNARLYMVHELPATFLVDAENRIVEKGLRGDALRDTVAKLLKKSKKK